MSNRQQLAEHGTGFCLAAMGVAASGGALVSALIPVAVLTAIAIDRWDLCDTKTLRQAQKAAEEALRASGEISEGEIEQAFKLLKYSKAQIHFVPEQMVAAEVNGTLPEALVAAVFGGSLQEESQGIRDAISVTLQAAFAILRTKPEYRAVFTETAVLDALRQNKVQIKMLQALTEKVDQGNAMLKTLVQQHAEMARQLGVREEQLLALAKVISLSVSDPQAAYNELHATLQAAGDIRQRGSVPSNLPDYVDAVMARVQEKNDAGDLKGAEEEAVLALAKWYEEQEERAAQGSRLMELTIGQARQTRNVALAVETELGKLTLDGTADGFQALRDVRRDWYERGRDKGLAFDLEVAIGLAQASVDRAQGPDQRGTALNDLAIGLSILGERESGPPRLEEAVAPYRAALEEYTRDRVPLNWAGTQNNLGDTLRILGERESVTARLEEAVLACRAALEERTQDRVPLEWAGTQNNLGNALRILGERERSTTRLEEAVAAYRAALEECSQDRVPLDWAATQNNLGAALQTLGLREGGTARLEEAMEAYRAALVEWKQDRVPLDWALAQNNLGNALLTLGERESGITRLEEAVAAYRAALEERTRDRVPLEWAMTQNNLGNALSSLGERETGTARLEEAVKAYRAALEEWTRERVPLNWAFTHENLALVELTFAQKVEVAEKRAHLLRALDYVEASLEVFSAADTPYNFEKASRLKTELEEALALDE